MPGAPVPGPDSVVDLVLDLVPGEGERAGSSFGATSASVSVPATDRGPWPAPPAVAAADAVSDRAKSDPVPTMPTVQTLSTAPTMPEAPKTAEISEASEISAASGLGPVYRPAAGAPAVGRPSLRDARPNASDLVPAPAPEADASSAGDPQGDASAEAAEAGVLVMAGAASGTYGSEAASAPRTRDAAVSAPARGDVQDTDVQDTDVQDTVVHDTDVQDTDVQDTVVQDAVVHDTAPVPGPGLAPASLSVVFTGEDTGESRTDTRVDTGEFRADARVDTGRHQAVIANERTASIPVHLLFREEAEAGEDATALPATVVRRAPVGEQPAGVRRPPVPRTPQVRPPTRPAPVADPRLHERPGPALPGWVAVLTGAGGIAAIGGVLWWAGALPARVLSRIGVGPRPYDGLGIGAWAALALLVTVVLFAFGGLTRGRVGYTWVLTLFGRYRGTVRRTGLMWVSPLLLRRRVDVRLRHWRSEPLPAMDANGTALRVVVLVVWRVEDTVRATLGVEDHEEYLREQVEAAMARVLSQLPADAFHEDAHTLRNAEAVGDALTRMLKADCEPVGIEVYSAQPTGIEYAPEVAAAMQRRRIAAIDAKHRDSVLTSVVDAVDDTVNRLTARGLVELDDYERKSLVKDLTVAFYTGRSGGDSA
ncbi:SPFH domain-containing protein [Streptomyces sp. NPDC002809]|uniref:SPFH domain-containing protein n=1 Tax=Streptomyces sp. NPDC002809 TaxID=3154433 RepID=UPI00331B17E9